MAAYRCLSTRLATLMSRSPRDIKVAMVREIRITIPAICPGRFQPQFLDDKDRACHHHPIENILQGKARDSRCTGGGQNKDSEEEGVSFDHCQEYEMKGEQYGHAIEHVDDDKPQPAHRPTRNGPGAPTSVPLRLQPTRRTESFRKKAVRLH